MTAAEEEEEAVATGEKAPILFDDGSTAAAPTRSSVAERGERARAARAAATHLQVRFRGFGGYYMCDPKLCLSRILWTPGLTSD
eukprot:SAG11_NODE_1897_length_4085_cov_45.668587_2_plen_84_part_00